MTYATEKAAAKALDAVCRALTRDGVSEPSMPAVDRYVDGTYGYRVYAWHGAMHAVGFLTDRTSTWYNPGLRPHPTAQPVSRATFYRRLRALSKGR